MHQLEGSEHFVMNDERAAQRAWSYDRNWISTKRVRWLNSKGVLRSFDTDVCTMKSVTAPSDGQRQLALLYCEAELLYDEPTDTEHRKRYLKLSVLLCALLSLAMTVSRNLSLWLCHTVIGTPW